MRILLLEPFNTGSHQNWINGFVQNSSHDIVVLSMPGRYWKWRMHGGAVELAKQFLESNIKPDLILASDMLDLSTFLALTRKKCGDIPVALYFHENQLSYPWSPTDADPKLHRDNHYKFINYTSALAADKLYFNSEYHLRSFNEALPEFLSVFPDYKGLENVEKVLAKSSILNLGMELSRFDNFKAEQAFKKAPLILWNHRWEYDKNPKLFFEAMFQLQSESIDFELVVMGEQYQNAPSIFKKAKSILNNKIVHWGFTNDFQTYAKWLWKADILPVTANQDFFGGSVVEAIYCNCFPILPDRLAYPEHLPAELHSKHYYKSDTDFYALLKEVVSGFKSKAAHFQHFVAHYDWKTMAPIYDQEFEQMR